MGIVALGLAIGMFMPRVHMRGREDLIAEARAGEAGAGEAGADEAGADDDADAETPESGFAGEPDKAGAPGK